MQLKWILSLLFALMSLQPALSQTKTETLNNASVIKLIKAGLDNDIVIKKIETSSCKFDLSGDGLISLKSAGVSSEVIKAMMNKTEGKKGNTVSNANTVTASGLPEPELLNAIYFYDKLANKITLLERNTASLKTKTKALGYGGTEFVYELKGEQSPTRIQSNNIASFIVNIGNGTADNFVLYKVEVKRNARQAIGSKFTMTGMKGSQGVIAVDIKVVKQGVYELIPVTKLEKGEYFFTSKSADNVTTSNANVYAFGID